MSQARPATPPPEPRILPPGTAITSIAIFLSGCGLILVIGGILMWLNHALPDRKNDNLRPYLSPDGKRQAVLFRRTVQGRNAFTTHVAILGAREKLPNRSGKAFIAAGEPAVQIHWLDNNHLIINDADGTEVILRSSQVGDVLISDH